jgi:MFS family permease
MSHQASIAPRPSPLPPPRAGYGRFRGAVRALEHRNYRLFFSGQLISLIGTWTQSIGESWLVYRLTGSSALLGITGFCAQIPVFLLASVGGTVADRHNRHRIIICTQTAAMLLASTLAALTLSGHVRVWQVFTLAALLGTVNAFDIPARQAFLVELVGREDLVNAIALNSSMVNGARIVGPAIAGVVIAAVGEGWCFLANAVSYIAVLSGLLLMRIGPRPIAPRTGSVLSEVLDGFRFVRRTMPVRALLLLLGIVSFAGMPYAVLMPVFADRILHGGARALGMLMGAAGLGAMAGALTLAARRSLRGLGRWVAMASAGFGASLLLFSFSRSFALSLVLLVPVGFCMMVQMASSNTLIQSMVPDALRGRVMAIYSMMFMGMAPVGALFAGVMAERVGAPRTVAIGGVACLCGSALFASVLTRVRQEARQLILAQQAAAGEPSEQVGSQGVVVPSEVLTKAQH